MAAGTSKRVVVRGGAKPAAKKAGTGSKKAGAAKATAAKPAAKGGGSTGRTGAIAKINSNVAKIAKALRDGATMKSQKTEYGVSDDGPIRAALYRAGFDSKGAKHGETANSIDATKAPGKKAVVKLRTEEGAGWYRLAFLTGLSEADVKKVVADAGGPTGRVYAGGQKGR